MFKGKPTIDNLDHYLARREFDLALAAIAEELRQRPDNASLALRQAEVLVLAGEREKALEVYRRLAETYIQQGFYARAIAVTNKILRVDPERTAVTNELAQRIASHQQVDQSERARLTRAETPAQTGTRPGTAPTPPKGGMDAVEVVEIAVEPDTEPIDETAGRTAAEEARERDASRFFAAFPPAALEELLSVTAVCTFAAGDTIVREGDAGTSLFLIEEGHVVVRTSDPGGRELSLAELGPGDFFGEVSVLTGRPRTATIIACDPVTVLEIQRERLTGILERHPEVGGVLRSFYERRAQATAETMLARLRGQGG